jgi:hypothetical protein
MRAFLYDQLMTGPLIAWRWWLESLYAELRAGSVAPIPLMKAAKMSERLETLNKARARMVEDRDAHAKVLAAPFDRDKAERARNKFIEIQVLIDALDRAIGGERAIAPAG